MKVEIKLGEEFKNCNITFSPILNVTRNFERNNIIGSATVQSIDNNILEANIEINDKVKQDLFDFAISGTILSQNENIINDFRIRSVSIVPKGLSQPQK